MFQHRKGKLTIAKSKSSRLLYGNVNGLLEHLVSKDYIIYKKCKTKTILILMHQICISTNQVSSVVIRSKKLENREKKCDNCERADKTQSAMKTSLIRRRVELCMREIILRLKLFCKIYFFSWQFNSYSYFKVSTEVLSYWAVEILED
jgi:hypothetical protein